MAQLNPTDLKKLDSTLKGQPFNDVPAKSGMTISSMDYTFKGQPFVSNPDILTDKNYTKGSPSSLPADNTDLTGLTTIEITNVAIDDSDYANNQANSPNFNIFQFKDKNENNTDSIVVEWKGQTDLAPATSTVYLQVYNNDTEEWETLDSDNSSSVDTDFALTGNITTNLSDYYDVDYYTCFRIYQEVV